MVMYLIPLNFQPLEDSQENMMEKQCIVSLMLVKLTLNSQVSLKLIHKHYC